MKRLIFAVGVLMFVSPVSAQVRDLADLATIVRPNARLVVTDTAQETRTITFRGATLDGLEIKKGKETELIPLADIQRIEKTQRRHVGLAVGLSLGLVLGLIGHNGCVDQGYTDGQCYQGQLLLAGLTTGIGALVDVLSRQDPVVLYVAPRVSRDAPATISLGPLLDRQAVGARLAYRF